MNNKVPVSVIVPVKNEELNIGRCLECLQGFSEIIVVDSLSTDETCNIAKAHGAKVVEFEWNGKFPKKRNWVLGNFDFANEWVLFVDADEYVSESFKAEVFDKVKHARHIGFWLTYHNYFMGHFLKHGDKFRKLALFRRDAGEYEYIDEDKWSSFDMEIHEHPVLNGTVGMLKSPILHEDYKGMQAYIHRHNEYSSWEANRYIALRSNVNNKWNTLTFRQKLKYRLLKSWLFAPLYFVMVYFFKLGFMDGREGFMFSVFKAIYFFQIRCKIIELQKTKGRK
ncbi:MAG: glycosyltransferase family 2 protein [Planctomycetes bacterium]|nr:glycosyltransferase family 2 protein [Planctomycetota bacterium]